MDLGWYVTTAARIGDDMGDNGLRIGKISSIDYKYGMVRVAYQDEEDSATALLPYLKFNGEYTMPKVGEMVLVAHLANGSGSGVVLGGFWNKGNVPAISGANVFYKDILDSCRIKCIRGEYIIEAQEVKFETKGGGTSITNLLQKIEGLEDRVKTLESQA